MNAATGGRGMTSTPPINQSQTHNIMNLRIMLSLLSCCLPFAGSAAQAAAEKPNIIVFLSDDMGYGDPQCLNPDSKIPTPNIDRLAMQGMTFTDAHTASSICTPSRYGLLTGRYCWRSRVPTGIVWNWDLPLIENDRLTIPRMLKQHGYATACIGKWHLGMDWPLKDGSYISDHEKKRSAAVDQA